MTRSRLLLAGLALVALLGLWWGGKAVIGSRTPDTASDEAPHRTIGRDFKDALAAGKARGVKIPWTAPQRLDGNVTISGTVVDGRSSAGVGNVEVVFRSASGEETTMAGADGKYRIDVPAGQYRAFVRDETVLSVGSIDHVRLPGLPTADTAGVPDEALMPLVDAQSDADGVDLSVLRGGVVTVHVADRNGRPIKNAVLRARGPNGMKPTLGTDVAETDAAGTAELRLPAGQYELEATHAKFAGVDGGVRAMQVSAGDHMQTTVTLTAGCVIAGRVVLAGGALAGDGAIEKQWGSTDLEFAPSGKIASDGTFRWVTTEEVEVTLRAWPWKSPPSTSQQFSCRDGARFESVVFALPNLKPDIEGVLVDASGAPVPFAFIDLAPLDTGGISQQERTDSEGKWGVFHMPSGRYNITAHSPGRGVVSTVVNSPQASVRLALGGTGKLAGTMSLLASGSFELHLVSCVNGTSMVVIPDDRRIVTVTGGRFAIDDVPACDLQILATWRGHPASTRVTVPVGGVGRVELALGPPRAKKVQGYVRDESGHPIEGAAIVAELEGEADTTTLAVRTDAAGHYALETFSGASLRASEKGRIGFAAVGMANVDQEQVDIVVRDYGEGKRDTIDIPDDYSDEPSVN
jgi:hypothetical protein